MSFGQVEFATVAGVNILPLVDITATINSGTLTLQLDADGNPTFPASISITSPTAGDLIVSYTVTDGFTVTDPNGDPVFDVPVDINFDDSITNDAGALIDGDIITGLGDDSVTNSGVIDGEVFLSRGNDVFSGDGSDTSNIVFGEDGNDTLTGGTANDTLNGGDGDD